MINRRTNSLGISRRVALVALGGVSILLGGCFDLGGAPQTQVVGQLSVGPGVVVIERGPIYEGTFERGATIGEDGRFTVEISSTGEHGFHAYVNDYIYLPIAIQVEEGVPNRVTQAAVDWDFLCEFAGQCEWVDQPPSPNILTPGLDEDLTNNPEISNAEVLILGGGTAQIGVDVMDPNGDLSNQILVHHVGSGLGVQLNPPGPVIDGNYPNGRYTATVYVAEGTDPGGPWQFVAADHECSNSPVLTVMATRN